MVLFVRTESWKECLREIENQNQEQEAVQLETERRSAFYNLTLKLVSIWAMITNLFQATLIKIFKERNKSFKKIIWEMGRNPKHVSSLFFDRFSKVNHQAKVGAAGWRVLDICYNYYKKYKPPVVNIESALTELWSGRLENRQAVRNRLILVVEELKKAFLEFSGMPEIRLVSVASGSAQAVIEAMKALPHLPIKAVLIDLDATALEYARNQAKEAGLEERFTFIEGPTSLLEKTCEEFPPHVVEMVGFLDYRPDKKAIHLISRIRKNLEENGFFLTCNINKNREKIFLDWVLLWPMIYRPKERLEELLQKGGFKDVRSFYEPHKIHSIAVCRK